MPTLAGTNLRGADAGDVNFNGAMLEDANLQKAGLRFAKFDEAILVSADRKRADLWGRSFKEPI